MKKRLPSVARDAAVQAAGSYIATAAQLLRGVILAKMLGPTGVGTVAAVALLIAYGMYQDLGLSIAATREIPLSAGAGRPEEVDDWRLHCVAGNLLGGLLLAAMIVALVVVRGSALDPQLRFGILCAAAIVVLQGVTSAEVATLIARKSFTAAAAVTAGTALGGLVAAAAGAAAAGVKGVFAAMVATQLLAAVLAVRLGGVPAGRRLRRAVFARLIKAGVPLSIISFATYNLVQLDQLIVLRFLDRRALGIYVLVLYMGTGLMLLPRSLAVSVAPRLLQRYGETPTLQAISELTWRPVQVLSALLPGAIMAVWVLGGLLIDYVLPLYREAIGPLRIYLVGVFFLALNTGPSSTLQATKKYLYHLPIVVAAIAFNVAIDFVLVRQLGLGLPGVALGSAISYTLYWFAHTFLVRYIYDPRPLNVVAFNLSKGWPGAVLAIFALVSWKMGFLAASRPLIELIFCAVVVVLTVPRLKSLRAPVTA